MIDLTVSPAFRRLPPGSVGIDQSIADTKEQMAALEAVDLSAHSVPAKVKHRLKIRGLRQQLEYLEQMKARQPQ